MDSRLTREEIVALTSVNDQEWMAAEEHLDTIELVLMAGFKNPEALVRVLANAPSGGVFVTLMKCCALVVGRVYLIKEERENQDAE